MRSVVVDFTCIKNIWLNQDGFEIKFCKDATPDKEVVGLKIYVYQVSSFELHSSMLLFENSMGSR